MRSTAGGSTAAGLLAHLNGASFHGPRGHVRFDDGGVVGQSFHLTRTAGDAVSADAVSENLEGPPLLGEQHLLARRKLAKQGWINPYLCA